MTKRIGLLITLALILAGGAAFWLLREPPAPPAPAATSATPWGANYFPNVELISHDGKKLRFFDDVIKDKVVMLNFIYTSCIDSCPLETARLRQVQKLLGDRVGKDVFLYSITIDPDHDTPEVLADYAKKFQAGPGWEFLWGTEPDVTQIRKKFGIYEPTQNIKANLTDHIISLVIGNQKTGRWQKSSAFDTPQVLASKVGSWLHNWKLPTKEDRNYANAPELRSISHGESMFRTRCGACHTIGGGDKNDIARGDIGPDLLGVVAKRERSWLIRMLAEPDKLLEEKDPLAVALLQQYNGVLMPNLRLSEADINDLITYLEEESQRLSAQ
jgi:cytochrome oxidase Cu insertion factor (SCO1/SenC/PrrC family)